TRRIAPRLEEGEDVGERIHRHREGHVPDIETAQDLRAQHDAPQVQRISVAVCSRREKFVGMRRAARLAIWRRPEPSRGTSRCSPALPSTLLVAALLTAVPGRARCCAAARAAKLEAQIEQLSAEAREIAARNAALRRDIVVEEWAVVLKRTFGFWTRSAVR